MRTWSFNQRGEKWTWVLVYKADRVPCVLPVGPAQWIQHYVASGAESRTGNTQHIPWTKPPLSSVKPMADISNRSQCFLPLSLDGASQLHMPNT